MVGLDRRRFGLRGDLHRGGFGCASRTVSGIESEGGHRAGENRVESRHDLVFGEIGDHRFGIGPGLCPVGVRGDLGSGAGRLGGERAASPASTVAATARARPGSCREERSTMRGAARPRSASRCTRRSRRCGGLRPVLAPLVHAVVMMIGVRRPWGVRLSSWHTSKHAFLGIIASTRTMSGLKRVNASTPAMPSVAISSGSRPDQRLSERSMLRGRSR